MDNDDHNAQANAGGGAPALTERVVIAALQGIRNALRQVEQALEIINDGVNRIEALPLDSETNQPVTVASIRSCVYSIQQSGISIQGAVDGYLAHPEPILSITTAVRMMSLAALAIHSILVHSVVDRTDSLVGRHFPIQLGLASLNVALAMFQINISRIFSIQR